jgi:hypothetical protein
MPTKKHDLPFATAYLVVLTIQLPVWMCAGQFWAFLTAFLSNGDPVAAIPAGLAWGICMWVVMGNLFAIGLGWRRTTVLPIPDRETFLVALKSVCDKLRLVILAAGEDELVLGPKRALIRFRMVEVRFEMSEEDVVLSAPAISFGSIRKALRRELMKATNRV